MATSQGANLQSLMILSDAPALPFEDLSST